MSSGMYAANLMGGFDLLYKRIEEVLASTLEISKFFRDLSAVESDYAKSLVKLNQVKSGIFTKSSAKAGEKEIGTLREAWEKVQTELEDEANRRALFSQSILKDISEAIANYVRDKEAEKKKLIAEGKKMTKEFQDVLDALKKSKDNYESKCKDAEKAQQQYEEAKTKGTMKPKDLNKLSASASRALDTATLADNEYKKTIKKANSKQAKYFELEMPMHLKEFQKFEENRIQFLKKQMLSYISLKNELPPFLIEQGDLLRKCAESVNIESDVKTYSEENRTNFTTPPEIMYEAHVWSNPSLAASASHAQSAMPSAPLHSSEQATRDFGSSGAKKFDISTKVYGLSPAEESLPKDQKIKKLQEQFAEIKADLRAETHSKKGLEKLVKFYASDPAAQDKAKNELEDQNKKISFLKDARSKVHAKLVELGDTTTDDGTADDDADERDGGVGVGGAVAKARGLYDYSASNDTELSFGEGDILTITEQDESGWWYAELKGNVGFIPRNYVELIS